MAEITEQEAREAAKQIPAWVLLELSKEVCEVLMWATCELSRRDAERAERDRPIDAEWLESIGFYRDTTESRYFENQHIVGAFYLRNSGVLVWRCDVYELFEASTRGQLLDLLVPLKGGDA